MRHSLVALIFILTFTPLQIVASEIASISSLRPVKSNESFEVQFTGPKASSDVIRIADAAGKPVRGLYSYAGNAKGNVLRLNAPFEAGTYHVEYVSNGAVIVQTTLVVTAVTASVTPELEVVNANEYVLVNYDGPKNNGDYIQFVDQQGKPVRTHYGYVGLTDKDSVKIRAPMQTGPYTLEYFTGNHSIGVATITVTSVSATVSAPAEVQAGGHFIVDWTGPNSKGDRIDIVQMDGTRTGIYSYPALYPEKISLRAPEDIDQYRVIYRTGDQLVGETTITVLETTATLQAAKTAVGNARFAVNWEGPGNHGDSVQLFASAAEKSTAWEYVQPSQSNVVMIFAPESSGEYVLKYVTHGNKVLATRDITITPAEIKPGSLRVLANSKMNLNTNNAIEVVLDASGSMLQRQNGERRIEIAKRTLGTLLRETIPEGTPFAMRVFGHKEANKCRTDLEMPLAPLNRSTALATLASINAKNLAKTPIAESLRLTASDLRSVTGERIIVLLTDGEETCDGDAAGVIASIRTQFSDIRVNIVGYAIDDAGLQETFTRWASLGGGEYYDANSEEELRGALTSAVNPSFVVLDKDGHQVVTGVAGGESVLLAPGEYRILAVDQSYPVKVVSTQLTSLSLE